MITGAEVLKNPELWQRLRGSFFHRLDDTGQVDFQGIVEDVTADHLCVDYFDWLLGARSERGQIARLELERYRFYDSDHAMRQAYTEIKYGARP